LDLAGVCESKKARFQATVSDPAASIPLESPFLQCMAACHSLIKLRGDLTGNPLDVKLFEAIEWDLREQNNAGVNPDYGLPTPTLVSPPKGRGANSPSSAYQQRNGGAATMNKGASNLEIALLKTYPFDSAVQRMTVVAKKKGSPAFEVYVKGAPEKVASLCKPETIPPDFHEVLSRHTKQGLRVLAAASRTLDASLRWKEVDGLQRGQLEEKCDFLGLIIMQNLVKQETYGAIKELQDADIGTVMVTGDNILTAISVGRDCELVKPEETIVRVEAQLVADPYSVSQQRLDVRYVLEDPGGDGVASSGGRGRKHHQHNRGHSRPNPLRASNGDLNYVFACEGKTFALIMVHDRQLLDRIVQRGKIFARMLPEQKIHLIEAMKGLG